MKPSARLQTTASKSSGFASWFWLWGPAVAVMAGIFVASSIPSLSPPMGVSDKTAHVLAYGTLGGFMLRALAGGRWAGVTLKAMIAAIVLTSAYGVTDEVHQMFTPNRFPEVLDVVADTIGAATASGAAWAWSIIRPETSRSRGV